MPLTRKILVVFHICMQYYAHHVYISKYSCHASVVCLAAGHEDLCGHGLGHPPGAPAAEGHHGAGAGHRGRHQAVQQVCEARLRPVHRAHHAVGRHRRTAR